MTPQQRLAEARALIDAGRAADAEALLQPLLRSGQPPPEASHLLGAALARQRRFEPAIFHLQRAAAGAPHALPFHATLATTLSAVQRYDEAIAIWDRLLSANPRHVQALSGRGIALASLARFAEAREAFDRAIELAPARTDLRRNRATLLRDLGMIAEAADELRAAIAMDAADPILHADLAGLLNYLDGPTPEEVFIAHRRVGELVEPRAPRLNPQRDGSPDRPLTIGYLSADLRAHSVATFIEPLLRQHDRAGFRIRCYSTTREPDAVSARLRQLADHWRDVHPLDDLGLARQIDADAVDVLIELNGLTTGQRLGVMACRPAPLQLTYCGYANTTGFTSIDYWVVDGHTRPPGADSLAAEKLLRLDPCFLCYQPPAATIDPGAPPSAAAGVTTFGSFNMVPKISDAALRLWSTVLQRVPNSRLLLKAKSLDNAAVRAHLLRRAASAGIPQERLDLLAFTPTLEDHLRLYQRIDVALDTYPYHGTTTTCEALWMGVPVLSRIGESHAARVGLSLLSAAGLPDLAAPSDDAFVETAAALAADHARLADLRATLRPRLLSSPLCDAPAFARRFESALRDLWRAHCRA